MGLSIVTTIISLSIITWMWMNPIHFVFASGLDRASLQHIAGFAFVRTAVLSLVFGYVVMKKQFQLTTLVLIIMGLVQLGDTIIALAYAQLGAAIGPIISVLVYGYTAWLVTHRN